jgi:chitodextrinase
MPIRSLVSVAAAATGFVLLTCGSASAATFLARADAHVSAAYPHHNFGDAAQMRVGLSPTRQAYVRFRLRKAPPTSAHVILRLYVAEAGRWLIVRRTGVRWREESITFANAPRPRRLVAAGIPVAHSWLALDVSSAVDGAGVYAFAIETSSSTVTSNETAYRTGLRSTDSTTVLASGKRSRKARLVLDTADPTAPTGLALVASTPTSVSLRWNSSTDDVGIIGYEVDQGSVAAVRVGGTSAEIDGLSCATSYSFSVVAFDAAGNRSQPSEALVVPTAACDTEPPSQPAGLTASPVSRTSLKVSWAAATDNLAVDGYNIYLDGRFASSTSLTSYTLDGLPCGSAATVGVEAFDAAGNVSNRASIIGTTLSCATPDPSGESMPIGDLPGWRQIFSDDFSVDVPLGDFPSAVSSKWKPYPYPWKDTSKNGTYWPQKGISQHGGLMDIWLHTESVDGVAVHVVNAPQPILPGTSRGQLYGRYVVRFTAEAVPGFKTAWLLWPDSNTWPRDGEIDFPEGNLTEDIYAFMHRQGATTGSDQDWYATGANYASWHTAVIEWLPTRCTFILDGKVIGNSTSRIPNTPMHWVLQTETQLSGGAPAESAAGHVYIDWVAVYAPA